MDAVSHLNIKPMLHQHDTLLLEITEKKKDCVTLNNYI